MLINLNQILPRARQNGSALGAFNFNNLEFLQAILGAAEELKSPVVLQTSEGAVRYLGLTAINALADSIIKSAKVPLVLHLDHGQDLNIIKKIIRDGFYTSVMFDGSFLPFSDNVKQTREIVKLAHRKDISVEAELGVLAGIEDKISSNKSCLTDPEQAAEFVAETGCDALAVSIGTSHGAYKFQGQAKLDLKRLAEIAKRVEIPLVLHGASGVNPRLLKAMRKDCRKINDCQRVEGAQGVPDEQIKKAIGLGVAKVNIDTDLRLAFTAAVRDCIFSNKKVIDPRKYLGAGREAVKEVVKEKIKLFAGY